VKHLPVYGLVAAMAYLGHNVLKAARMNHRAIHRLVGDSETIITRQERMVAHLRAAGFGHPSAVGNGFSGPRVVPNID
jgi:hypothetical protein